MCSQLMVEWVPRRGVENPPGPPGAAGKGDMGVERDWNKKWRGKIEVKNEKVQKLRSGEVPQGPCSMEMTALMWGLGGLPSGGLGTRLDIILGIQPGALGGQIWTHPRKI